MTDWTKARSYIIRMTAAQTQQLYAEDRARLKAQYNDYVRRLLGNG